MSESKANRLIHEKSPYLLQHAGDPVYWYPWSEEAFELARRENKPIFLSIGYASCHWCHVMAKESFQDQAVASALNEGFISIKVDREELPHIDRLYMDFAAAMQSGTGGWPLNVFLTPDLKPMYAATYLPAKTSGGMMGILELIGHIHKIWNSDERAALFERADQVVQLFEKITLPEGSALPTEEDVDKIVQSFFTNVDATNGGFEGAPKFPQSYALSFLMNFANLQQDARAAFYVRMTLDHMGKGGLLDHIGGGFHRYTVDAKWTIPHFEKMLYDNALLAEVYIDAYRCFQDESYKAIANQTLDFLLSEMRSEDGGFYSSIDADSEGQEGLYYTWSIEEVERVLTKEEAAICCQLFQMSHAGNFEGKSVLFRLENDEEYASKAGVDLTTFKQHLDSIKKKLHAARSERARPFIDDKVLTSWNALVLQTLAKGARFLGREDCKSAAKDLLAFIQAKLSTEHGLMRRYRENEAKYNAILDDYAFFIRALLTLYEYDFGSECLDLAESLFEVVIERFKSEKGAFYFTEHQDAIFFRNFECYDGAEPSGNSVALECALRLYALTKNADYRAVAEDALMALREKVQFYSPGNAYQGLVMQRYIDDRAMTMVVVLDDAENLKEEIWDLLSESYLPHLSIFWVRKSDVFPWEHDEKELVDDKSTVYLCLKDRCLAPITEISILKEQLGA